jgi:predicted Zn-dependent peptidase
MNYSPGGPVYIAHIIPAGSWNDPIHLPGLAHFVEHIVCRLPPQNFPDHSLTSYFANFGGWIDAYTTYDRTVFHVAVLPEYQQMAEDALEECLFSPRIGPVELFLERRIVAEQVFFNYFDYNSDIELFKKVYGKSSKYARRIIGTPHSINRVTEQDILSFWSKHYVPQRCTKIICRSESLLTTGSAIHFTAPKRQLRQRTAAIAQRKDWTFNSLDLYLILLLPPNVPMEQYAQLRLLSILLEQHLLFWLRHKEGLVSDVDVYLRPSPWRIHLSIQYSQQENKRLLSDFPQYIYDFNDYWDQEMIIAAIRTLKQELIEIYLNPYVLVYEFVRNLAYDPLQALDYVNGWLNYPLTLAQELAGYYKTLINSDSVVGILAGNVDSEGESAFTKLIHMD